MADKKEKKDHFRNFNDQEADKIRFYWNEYAESLKNDGGQGFEERYGAEAIDTLTEGYRRLNQQNQHLQTTAELDATRMYEDAATDQAYSGISSDEPVKERRLLHQIRKGGVRGTALLWNGIVDMGRGAIDPENWFYWVDMMRSVNDGLGLGERDRAWQNYVKEIKQQGVRGEKGFANAWMRAVMERDELAQYKQELGIENDIFAQQREGGAGIKFDKIPFLNEDLGLAGNAVEIAVQEILTMGPLALGKLYRANKVAKYFAAKAGGPIKPGRTVKGDGYRSSKVETELGDSDKIMKAVDEQDVNYQTYLDEIESLPLKEQKKKLELLKVNQTKGKILNFSGGAYSEAEIITSANVVAGGLFFQSMFGEGASVIGEVGGGIAGARITGPVLRNATDWLTYLNYKLPGTRDGKMQRALKGLGYTDDEILKMNSKKKASLFNAVTAMPIPRWMGFTSRERKRLNHMRHWDKEFQSLPDDIKDPLMERVSEVKRLVKRFDDRVGGEGKLFTTIDRAFDMAWLASLRELARNKKRIGHGVKVKFDIDEMKLVKRELAVAKELNSLLTDLSKKAYGDTDFEALLSTMDAQLLKNMQRIKAQKLTVSKQADEILKAVDRRMPTDKKQFTSYTDPGGFRNNWDEGISLKRESDTIDKFDKTAAEELGDAFSSTADEAQKLALEQNNLRLVPVNHKNGEFSHNILMPISRASRSTSVAHAEESKKIFDDMYDADRAYGEAQYDTIDGFKVSPSSAWDAKTQTNKKIMAIDSRGVNEITASIGDNLVTFMENNPGLGTRTMTKVKGQDVNLYEYLTRERLKALQRYENEFGSKKYNQLLEDLNNDLDTPYELDLTMNNPTTGEIMVNKEGITDLENMIAGSIDVALPESVRLDISLADIHSMRSGLMRNAMPMMKSNAQRVSGGLNLKIADILTSQLDDFDAITEANQVWKTQIGDKWRRGIGRRISSGITEPEQFFQQFINSSTPTSAFQDFERMFGRHDGTYDEEAVNLLRQTVENMLDNNRTIPPEFWRNFGEDVLNVKLRPGEDIVQKSKSIYRTTDQRMKDYSTEIGGVKGNIADDINQTKQTLQEDIDLLPENLFEGLTLEKMQGLFGRQVVDKESIRKAIISESYEGGDSRRLLALTKLLGGKNISKTNKRTLQKILHDGAMEEAYSIKSTRGVGYEEAAVEVLEDGSKQLKPGRLHEQLEVDSSAMQIYLTRNNKVLEQIMEPEQLEDLKSLSSLVTLVTGDIGRQAVENFPRSMKLQSLLSRAYGVVRGVVSPRYVMTELLIQYARFGRGKMITDMATDPDSFELLSDVILRDGLTKPRIRGEFVEYFYGTVLRIGRDVFEGEGAGDLQTISENVWNQAGGGN